MITPGEILKNKRQSLGKTIFEVSQETRILEKYIKQIELNKFDEFDSPVFARGFIKIYAQFLNLDEEKVLALFRRENKDLNTKNEKKTNKKIPKLNWIGNSKNIIIASTTLIVVVALSLLYYQLYLFQLMPNLEIISPLSGSSIENPTVEVSGVTDNNSLIFVNEAETPTNDGVFKQNIELKPGENVINVKAKNKKNNSKVTESVLKVTYVEKKVESKRIDPITLNIEILDESSWVKLNIDGLQKLAQILKPNFIKKYIVTKEFEIVTGRPDQTKVTINNVEKVLKINDKTGVATLYCKLTDIELSCESK